MCPQTRYTGHQGGIGNIMGKAIFSKHRPSAPMLSISQFVQRFVCLCVCVFTFKVPIKCLFAPTSQSQMSKILRDLESLGKSGERKCFHIWKLFQIKDVKSLHFLGWILQQSGGYTTRIRKLLTGFGFGFGATIRIGREILCLRNFGFFVKRIFTFSCFW